LKHSRQTIITIMILNYHNPSRMWTHVNTLFFLYQSGHLRHLHSFPTRRSSDLVTRYITFRTAAASLTALVISLALGPWLIRKLRDRKSTRLNSSHRTISYAVFCLKKKKTINRASILTVIS